MHFSIKSALVATLLAGQAFGAAISKPETNQAAAAPPGGQAPCVAPSACQKASNEADGVAGEIQKLTRFTMQLAKPASALTPNQVTSATTVTKGIAELTNLVIMSTNNISMRPPFEDKCDTGAIAASLTQFKDAQKQVMDILMKKSGMVGQIPFLGQPISVALKNLQFNTGSWAQSLIRLLPAAECFATKETDSMSQTLDAAIKVYSMY